MNDSGTVSIQLQVFRLVSADFARSWCFMIDSGAVLIQLQVFRRVFSGRRRRRKLVLFYEVVSRVQSPPACHIRAVLHRFAHLHKKSFICKLGASALCSLEKKIFED